MSWDCSSANITFENEDMVLCPLCNGGSEFNQKICVACKGAGEISEKEYNLRWITKEQEKK